MDDKEIIECCEDFLRKSDTRYNTPISRAINDLELYSGNFWNETMRKKYRKGKTRICLAMNNWQVISNAVASPFSNSPWHAELTEKTDPEQQSLQQSINDVESENDTKTSLQDAFRKAVLTGYGYIVVSTDVDDLTGEPKIVVESAKQISSVALDPNVNTVDGSDAEEGAIINYISTKKAKRLYGEDVIPFNYPDSQPLLSLSLFEQWSVPHDSVAIVSYYRKNEDGMVEFYKICGNKVVQSDVLPIKYIPILRIAGNEIYENGEINYNGIIQQTLPLELGANTAFSTLIERCGRSTKANFIAHVDAVDGLEKYYARCDQDDAMAVLWKGDHQPVPLTESFQTGDLSATISTCRTLMEDTVGVPLTGISANQPEKTATEILRQQISKESNTANYYNNAYIACRTLSKIIVEMLNDGEDVLFTLENGPSVITRQMKARQEINALSGICPENMKPVLAKYFADTLKDDIGEDLSKNIVANLPVDVKLVSDHQDPLAIHQLEQMKATLDQTMQQLQQAQQENAQLKNELNTAQMNLMENREARVLDWQKFQITEQNKMALEAAKLQSSNAKAAADIEHKQRELELDAEKEMADTIQKHNEMIMESQR